MAPRPMRGYAVKDASKLEHAMNIKNPLAAALLMISASASAQLLYPGPSAADDEMVFKCGFVPYRLCTEQELAARRAAVMSGRCPMPASDACQRFMMQNGDTTQPAGTIAAKNPPKKAKKKTAANKKADEEDDN